MPFTYEEAYRVIKRIPKGMVMSYAGVARQCGRPGVQRAVGYALRALPADSKVPWWRVINSQGKCSTGRLTIPMNLQQELLEAGYCF